MAFYGNFEWNYVWGLLPTESEATYKDYIGKLNVAVVTNNQVRVEELLLDADETKPEEAQRLSAQFKLKQLRDTAAGDATWRHYFCEANGEEVFTCTLAHWHTVFTNPTP